jgi:hypothetical protein
MLANQLDNILCCLSSNTFCMLVRLFVRACLLQAGSLVQHLADDMASEDIEAKTLTLKLKTTAFVERSRSVTLPQHISSAAQMLPHVLKLLRPELPIEIRLMGVGGSKLRKKTSGSTGAAGASSGKLNALQRMLLQGRQQEEEQQEVVEKQGHHHPQQQQQQAEQQGQRQRVEQAALQQRQQQQECWQEPEDAFHFSAAQQTRQQGSADADTGGTKNAPGVIRHTLKDVNGESHEAARSSSWSCPSAGWWDPGWQAVNGDDDDDDVDGDILLQQQQQACVKEEEEVQSQGDTQKQLEQQWQTAGIGGLGIAGTGHVDRLPGRMQVLHRQQQQQEHSSSLLQSRQQLCHQHEHVEAAEQLLKKRARYSCNESLLGQVQQQGTFLEDQQQAPLWPPPQQQQQQQLTELTSEQVFQSNQGAADCHQGQQQQIVYYQQQQQPGLQHPVPHVTTEPDIGCDSKIMAAHATAPADMSTRQHQGQLRVHSHSSTGNSTGSSMWTCLACTYSENRHLMLRCEVGI